MKICLWTGPSWEPWGPPSLDSGGIGGSETAAVHLGFELARLGHTVELHGQHEEFEGYWAVPTSGPGPAWTTRSVHFHPTSAAVKYVSYQRAIDDPKTIDCDVLVASRDKRTVRLPFRCRSRVLWVHDVHVGDDWEHEVAQHDRVYALSEWHRGYMAGIYEDVPPHKFKVTRNGIDPARFAPSAGPLLLMQDKRPDFVYSSSPDRGLDVLLDVWSEVRKIRDDAQLHVYYGFDNWRKLNAQNKRGLIIVDHMEQRVLGRETDQIYYHGRVGQAELAAAHLRSMVWAYPTNFSETYCISALEAQAAGAVPVTTRIAALAETVRCGTLLDPGNKTPRYKQELLASVAMQLAAWDRGEEPSAREWALSQTWEGVAREWVEDFAQISEAKRC